MTARGSYLGFKPAVAGFGFHDPSACIVVDGRVVAFVEEERLTRLKHSNNMFPFQAIKFCLKSAGMNLSDLDGIGVPYQPRLYFNDLARQVRVLSGRGKGFARVARIGRAVFERTIVPNLVGPTFLRYTLAQAFGSNVPPIHFFPHHLAHAASTYLCSPFRSRAAVLTMDGAGEHEATAMYLGQDGQLSKLRSYPIQHSLGHYYAAVTEFLGYHSFNDEYKVMGLAPYGSPDSDIGKVFESAVQISEGGVKVGIDTATPRDGSVALANLLGIPPRPKGETNEFDPIYKTIAFHAQKRLEEAALALSHEAIRLAGSSDLCLAGGVALNCKMNKVILDSDRVERLFIQPAANDSGLSLGVAALLAVQGGGFEWGEHDVYAGPSYDDDAIEADLRGTKMPYRRVPNPEVLAARLLADGYLVGWFQGRAETGPRALGNRSILANPTDVRHREAVNLGVKHREHWRPFAPSILYEERARVLESGLHDPFMILSDHVTPEFRERIPAVVHVDGTCRPQTVRAENNPSYHGLIAEFARLTGVPVVLNTSFNDNGEPIVTKPSEAIKDLYYMGLDVLFVGPFLLAKPHVPIDNMLGGAEPLPESATLGARSRPDSTQRV
jgi:carbamoyltransferase